MTMLKKIFFVLVLFVSLTTFGQELPYQWSVETSSVADHNQEGQILVKLKCTVDSSWHIYPTVVNGELGYPTTIKFAPSISYQLIGELNEPLAIEKYDSLLEETIRFLEGEVVFTQLIERKSTEAFLLNVSIETQACQESGNCTRPEISVHQLEIRPGSADDKTWFWYLIGGLAAGFLALLTPCVFPMIPLTVTFFTKQSESKRGGVLKAFIYGLSIVVIYVVLGFSVAALVGGEALNQMASSVLFNLLFFVILIVFAISFLGFFEITLPASFVNKMDAKGDKGGWIGIFFMAFALVLVSFSCTGPLIGTLLIEAVQGGVLAPIMGMLGFSLALALPFTLFAIFPNWMNGLPKSGGWLNAVKVCLGFLELALALKFLSNADLVHQANLLPREVFLAIWVVLFGLLAIYLLGWIRFKHDSKMGKLSVGRKIVAGFFIAFTVYLTTGFFGNSLNLLSGVLPPIHYSWFATESKDDEGRTIKHCPNDLTCYHDYQTALSIAKKQQKPLLVDFTGWTCTNCRAVEQSIWSVPVIDSLIRNEYVLVSLYVDSRKKLPKNQRFISKRNNKEVITYGDLWTDLEVSKFKEFTQPLYVLLDSNERLLAPKHSYPTTAKKYQQFLERGLTNYQGVVAK